MFVTVLSLVGIAWVTALITGGVTTEAIWALVQFSPRSLVTYRPRNVPSAFSTET